MRLTGTSLPGSYPCLPLPPKRKKIQYAELKQLSKHQAMLNNLNIFPDFIFSNLMNNILPNLPPMLTLTLGLIVFKKLE